MKVFCAALFCFVLSAVSFADPITQEQAVQKMGRYLQTRDGQRWFQGQTSEGVPCQVQVSPQVDQMGNGPAGPWYHYSQVMVSGSRLIVYPNVYSNAGFFQIGNFWSYHLDSAEEDDTWLKASVTVEGDLLVPYVHGLGTWKGSFSFNKFDGTVEMQETEIDPNSGYTRTRNFDCRPYTFQSNF